VLENRFPSLLSKQSSKQKKRITHHKSHLLIRVISQDPAPVQGIVGKLSMLVGKIVGNRDFSEKMKKRKSPETLEFQDFFWSCWADLNRRPHPYQLGRAYRRWSLFVLFYIILWRDQVLGAICSTMSYLVVPPDTP